MGDKMTTKQATHREYWICPEDFDTETGTWLGCEVRTSKPDDNLLPFNHVIEYSVVTELQSKLDSYVQCPACNEEYRFSEGHEKIVNELQSKLTAAENQLLEQGRDLIRLSAKNVTQAKAIEKLKEWHRNWINGARADTVYEKMTDIFNDLNGTTERGNDGNV